jgi:sugar phosphate isomerase/epimerase
MPWDSEELRTSMGVIDGYHIMAHYLFFTKDPMWVEMAKMYDGVMKRYKLNYDDPRWLDDAWKSAEESNDREFKEFFYSVCAAKFLEGHMIRIERWINDQFIAKELEAVADKGEREELKKIAKEIKITIELPDARDPQHAGLFMLWHPKQVYAAIRVIRKKMNNERVWLLADFEHLATQGVDPIEEMKKVAKIAPDYGSYCYGIHCNAPNPMHAHETLDLGDVRIYELLYYLRVTGFGKKIPVYVIYERGGGQDPFQHSVEVIRLCIKFLEKDIEPDELPDEYFGMRGAVAGSDIRQRQIIMDHMYDPLKDLLEMPEEDWTFLSQSAIKKGKRPEQWKKAEFR